MLKIRHNTILKTKKVVFLFFLILMSFNAFADVWADFHGTTSTAGIDSGTRYNPYSTLKPPLALLWSQTNWDGYNAFEDLINVIQSSSPAIANGIVYVGSTDSKLYAWNAATGATIAGFPVVTGGPINSSPAIANGVVYAGATDNKLYAWNAATGATIAGFPVVIGGVMNFNSAPAIANGIVYVGATDNKLYAWNAATGAAIAGFPAVTGTGGSIISSPAIANGIVYVGSTDGILYAWNAATGAAIAGFPVGTGGQIFSSPAIANGVVYVGSEDSKLYAWDAATGVGMPGFPVTLNGNSESTQSSPEIANGYVYIGDNSNALYAIDVTNGNIAWQYIFPDNYSNAGENIGFCSPALAENKLFMTSDEGNGIFVFYMPSPTVTSTITISPTITNTITITPTFTITETLTETLTITPSFTLTTTVTETLTTTATPPFCFDLKGAFPNPASTYTYFIYNICRDSDVDVVIYTVSGEVVRNLRQSAIAGWNHLYWDTYNNSQKNSASGVYIYSIEVTSDDRKQKIWGKVAVAK